MNNKIVFVCFTYERDASCALILADVVSRDGHAIVFVDDAAHPMSGQVEDALRGMNGVYYRTSNFDRRGNLNGPDAVKGILTELEKVSRYFNAGWVIKIDADTIPTPTLYASLAKTDKNVVTSLTASVDNTVYMCGAMYALRAHMPKRMFRLFDGMMARFNEDENEVNDYMGLQHCSKKLPEDQTMQQLVRCMGEPMDIEPLGWYDHVRCKLEGNYNRVFNFGCFETVKRPEVADIAAVMVRFVNGGRNSLA
jgi:hypothetical protein